MLRARKYLGLLATAIIIQACGSSEEPEEPRIAKGDVVYGGNLVTAESEHYFSLYPMDVLDVGTAKIVGQMYSTLVKFDQADLSIIPDLASFVVSADETKYTFELVDNAYFHADECFGGSGRQVTPEDVVFSFERLCTPEELNTNYENFFKGILKGAEEYQKGSAESISGISVDGNKIIFELLKPSKTFLYTMANPATSIIAKEAYDAYGKEMTVGSGPFKMLKDDLDNDIVYLGYHSKYHIRDDEGNKLPYLDSLTFRFYDNKLDEYDAFEAKEIHFMDGLPGGKVGEVVEDNIQSFLEKPPKFELVFEPEASTQFYEFNITKPPFDNILVRKAFNLAINKQKVIDNALHGQGIPADYGIVPKRIRAWADYPFELVQGYKYNPEMAKELLAQAGYPNGDGFPAITLVINSGGNINTKVANEIEQQLRTTLGINISYKTVPFAQKLEDAKYARADILRSAWVADYPSPENFLLLFNGENVPESLDEPSYPNTSRYKNAKFDSLYAAGLDATSKEEKYRLFAEAEAIMMMDAPVLLLWYGEDYKISYSKVRNLKHNALKYMDFSKIYLKTLTEEDFLKEKGLNN